MNFIRAIHSQFDRRRTISPRAIDDPIGLSRRRFLGCLGVTVAGSALGTNEARASVDWARTTVAPGERSNRLQTAYRLRRRVARRTLLGNTLPNQGTNGDHERYGDAMADFTKGLPHDDLGIVDPDAYAVLLDALESGDLVVFASIPLGSDRRLAEPEGAFGFELVGTDPHAVPQAPAPAFASAETAAETAELYWQALCRDVPFREYEDSDLIREAAADLSAFSAFAGPMEGNEVTPETVFRGLDPSNLAGPYLSQFLWQTVSRGAIELVPKIRTGTPAVDYLTDYDEWLADQRGTIPTVEPTFDEEKRYIRTGRDLASYVRQDIPFQAYENAAVLLLGMDAPFDPGLPYDEDDPTEGLLNFGPFDVLDVVIGSFGCALSAGWYHKWIVNKRLRPEAFAGRVHNHLCGRAMYPIHSDLLDSPVLERVRGRNGTYLLPQAYPEGSPLHPSYPAGHAVIAGACVTVLKAYFDEAHVFEDPVQASADGTALEPYEGSDLTVGNELRKLASNMAIGRNWAGIHYRSDEVSGLEIGEQVAISLLSGRKECPIQGRAFDGFRLTTFDGETITV